MIVSLYFADLDLAVEYEPRGDDVMLPAGSSVIASGLDFEHTLSMCASHFLARAFRTLLPGLAPIGD